MKEIDAWLQHDDHPGTKEFARLLREIADKEGGKPFSQVIYQQILDKLGTSVLIYADDSEQAEPRPLHDQDEKYSKIKEAYDQELKIQGSSSQPASKAASPLTPAPPSSVAQEVGEYWFDKRPWTWTSGESFCIREFVEKPPVPYFQRNAGFGRSHSSVCH